MLKLKQLKKALNNTIAELAKHNDLEWAKQLRARLETIRQDEFRVIEGHHAITNAQAAAALHAAIRACFCLTELAGHAIPAAAKNTTQLIWVEGGLQYKTPKPGLMKKLREAYGARLTGEELFRVEAEFASVTWPNQLVALYQEADAPAWAEAIANELATLREEAIALNSMLGFARARIALLSLADQEKGEAFSQFKLLEKRLLTLSSYTEFMPTTERNLANQAAVFAFRARVALPEFTLVAIAARAASYEVTFAAKNLPEHTFSFAAGEWQRLIHLNDFFMAAGDAIKAYAVELNTEEAETKLTLTTRSEPTRHFTFTYNEAEQFLRAHHFLQTAGHAADNYEVTAVAEHEGSTRLTLRSTTEPVREFNFLHTEAARLVQMQEFLTAAGQAANGYAVTACEEHEGSTRLTLCSTAEPVREFNFLHTEAARLVQMQAFLTAAGEAANDYAITACEEHEGSTRLTVCSATLSFDLLHSQASFCHYVPALAQLNSIVTNYQPTAGGEGHLAVAATMRQLLVAPVVTDLTLMVLNLRHQIEKTYGTLALYETAAPYLPFFNAGSTLYQLVRPTLYEGLLNEVATTAPGWMKAAYLSAELCAHLDAGRYPISTTEVVAADGSTHHHVIFKDLSTPEAAVQTVRFDDEGTVINATATAEETHGHATPTPTAAFA